MDMNKEFLENSEAKAFDIRHRGILNFNISRYNEAVIRGKKQYCNIELAKRRAASIKHKVINRLDDYLIEFEANFNRRGGKVIWAENTEECIKEIIGILRKSGAKLIVKQKSMITEEIELNHALEKNEFEVWETDLGEFIVQVAGEKPYHIITPVMHKSKEDVAELFHKKFNMPEKSTPEEITAFVRDYLRDKFIKADAGITGCNFLIADTGAVGLTENEGNGLLSISFPKIHITIAGIEKIIPSLKDLDLFLPLLATHGTGQNITVYNNIVFGPKQEDEADGPAEMYVILLDNKRTELMNYVKQREALACIRCGACLNGCPVYRNIGGYTYNSVYSGPIGSVISPFFNGFAEYKHLSYASSLCGKCYEVCPVKINLPQLLLQNRNLAVLSKLPPISEKILMKGWKMIMLNRKLINMVSPGMKNFVFKRGFKKLWGPRRTLPIFAKKSFNQQWKMKN